MTTFSRKLASAAILVLALPLALFAVSGCGGGGSGSASTAAATPFKVGVAGPMTGRFASYGASQKAGAQIAMDELNAGGGVNGGTASMALGDDLGDPRQAVPVAQKFIHDSGVVVVDGHMFSGTTIAAASSYQAAGLPMISPTSTSPGIGTLGGFIWRICMTDAAQGAGLARYSVDTLGKSRIAIMYDDSDSDYGRGLADAYGSGVKAAGGTIVASERYATGDTDFKAQIIRIKAAGPDLVFLAGYYPEGAEIARQARDLGMTTQFLGSDGLASDKLPKLGGAAVEGTLVSTFFDYTKQDPALQKFVAAYKAANDGANPDWFAADSYDVIMLAAQAARNAGKNERVAINDALGTIGIYQGVSGPITFDKNGDVVKPLQIVVVHDGALATAPRQPTP